MDERPDIEQNEVDLAVSAWAVTLGYMPAIGPIVAELLRSVIPNQRHDRIADFLRILDDKLSSLEDDFLKEKMRTEEFIDLFEDGAYQAARALTNERKERIAALLKNSLTDEDLTHVQQKTLLSLLGELNDVELLLLKFEVLSTTDPMAAQEFFEKHEDALRTPLVFSGSPEEDADRHALHETYRNKLRRLGLLRATYKKPKKGQLPEFDEKTGMMKAGSNRATSLGRLLLRYVEA
ncbi:MAG: hypothetical protein WA990_00450 [Rubrobacteraceae bacterium]